MTQVTTDSSGIGIVTFLTSHDTAAQSFSVVARNPGAPSGRQHYAWHTGAGYGTGSGVPAASVFPTAVPTTIMTTVPVVNATPVTAPLFTPASELVRTPLTETPLSPAITIAAAGTAFLVWGRNRR